jgi:hypothetical protein
MRIVVLAILFCLSTGTAWGQFWVLQSNTPAFVLSTTQPSCSAGGEVLAWGHVNEGIPERGELCSGILVTASQLNSIPPPSSTSPVYVVMDGVTADDCTTGGAAAGSAFLVRCGWNPATQAWEAAAASQTSLQSAYTVGTIGGWDHVVDPRPLTLAPERRTLGLEAAHREEKGVGGMIVRTCRWGPNLAFDCDPDGVYLPLGGQLLWEFDDGAGTAADLGTLTNSAGVITGTGIFAMQRCVTIESVATGNVNRLLGFEWPHQVTITGVGCRFEATATTPAQFSLEDGSDNAMTITGGTPTCVAANAAMTYAPITAGGTLSANEPLRFNVTNTPNPSAARYQFCVRWRLP